MQIFTDKLHAHQTEATAIYSNNNISTRCPNKNWAWNIFETNGSTAFNLGTMKTSYSTNNLT